MNLTQVLADLDVGVEEIDDGLFFAPASVVYTKEPVGSWTTSAGQLLEQ
jgi:hypothetical protein